jgi:hypothetical protein
MSNQLHNPKLNKEQEELEELVQEFVIECTLIKNSTRNNLSRNQRL